MTTPAAARTRSPGAIRAEEEWPVVVSRDDEHSPCPVRTLAMSRDLTGHEESALGTRARREVALAVAAQKNAVARRHPTDLRLEPVEVAGEEQIGVAVVIEIAGENAIHRRELCLVRQRHERERAVAFVEQHRRRERARLLEHRVRRAPAA